GRLHPRRLLAADGYGPRVRHAQRPLGQGPGAVEDLVSAYRGKRVLLTGHTGFKGSWLALWLRELGSSVTGFALPPDTTPALCEAARVGAAVRHVEGDLRELDAVRRVLRECEPDYVFHLAAQPLVRRSYEEPLPTIETNVLGTAHV